MARVYGVDLGDVWRGRLSLRRLLVLVRYLPPGSAVWAEQAGIEFGWSLTDFLLADLFQVWANTPHPARPVTSKKSRGDAGELVARLKAQRERLGASGL